MFLELSMNKPPMKNYAKSIRSLQKIIKINYPYISSFKILITEILTKVKPDINSV